MGCSEQTVRNTIQAFNTQGVACLQRASSRPHPTRERIEGAAAQRLQTLLPQSPRTFGHPISLWTLELAAEVSFAQGLTPQRVSREAIRTALCRLGVSWQHAKRWIISPDLGHVLGFPSSARRLTTRNWICTLDIRRSFPDSPREYTFAK